MSSGKDLSVISMLKASKDTVQNSNRDVKSGTFSGSCTLATVRVPNAEVHHGSRQVSGAAPAAQVGVCAIVLGVEGCGERRGEMQVAEIG